MAEEREKSKKEENRKNGMPTNDEKFGVVAYERRFEDTPKVREYL